MPWNHNIHYHSFLIKNIPKHSRRALDVGCGTGLLSKQLAVYTDSVLGIDLESSVIENALHDYSIPYNIEFIAGDILNYPFPLNEFDFISAVATLHHLPLEKALQRFKYLLKSEGVLTVIGLYRPKSLIDFTYAIAGGLASKAIQILRQKTNVKAPQNEPKETLKEIREATAKILPGAVIKRRLLFRYTLVWRNDPNVSLSNRLRT